MTQHNIFVYLEISDFARTMDMDTDIFVLAYHHVSSWLYAVCYGYVMFDMIGWMAPDRTSRSRNNKFMRASAAALVHRARCRFDEENGLARGAENNTL